MPRINTTCDVFISSSFSDADLVNSIAAACRASGLEPFTGAVVNQGKSIADALWEALSESKAVIAVLSGSELPQSMAIELGGARAWNKPIYGVLRDPTVKPAPVNLGNIHLYTSTRIDDLIRAIKFSGEDFSDHDRNVLASLYSSTGIPVDRLALDPRHLEALVRRFERLTNKVVTGERLLSELLRLRKRGKLAAATSIRGTKRQTPTG